jgi:peptide/nickel transport system substrate-binding protein
MASVLPLSQGASASVKATNAGSLTFGAVFASVNFNPWEAPNGDNETLEYNGALYDSLLVLKNNKPAPSLATSWQYTSPTTLVLHLRSGVRFDDGTPVDASAVKANFDYAETASPAGTGNIALKAVQTTVVNPTTVKLALPSPDPDLPYLMATGIGFIVNPKALANPSTLSTTPNGSGPYSLAASQSVTNQQYVFTRRAKQWNLANFPYSKVTIKIFSSPQAMTDALQTGQINFGDIDPNQVATLRRAGLNIQSGALNGIEGIWINDRAGTLVKALGNQQVRQALNYAVNRAPITNVVNDGTGVPGSLVVPPGSTGYTKTAASLYTYNPKKAKSLLAKAGYGSGFTLPILSTPAGDTLVQAVAGYWRSVGINVQISDHSTDFVTQAFSGKWPTMVFTWGMVPLNTQLQELLSPSGTGNPNHSTDPQIEAELNKVLTTTGAAQVQATNALVATVNQKGWFVITGYDRGFTATTSAVTCSGTSGCPLYTFRPTR